MGDAADDMFDAAMREEERRLAVLKSCPDRSKTCNWELDEDGLLECKTCGELVDP